MRNNMGINSSKKILIFYTSNHAYLLLIKKVTYVTSIQCKNRFKEVRYKFQAVLLSTYRYAIQHRKIRTLTT